MTAQVSHIVQLQNKLALIYAKEYIITLPITINDTITAFDTSGSIIKDIKKGENKTMIYLNFNHPNIGKDATTTFQINYRLNQLVTNKGKTKEIELPLPPESDETIIHVNTPNSFGQISYASLKPTTITTTDTSQETTFKEIGGKLAKILIAFGDNQLFDFQLSYYLSNPTNKIIIKEIPLPPTTNAQKVTFRTINPQPLSVSSDADGNWLAQYQLNSFENKTITVDGQVKISNEIGTNLLKGDYLQATPIWTTHDPTIQAIAQSLKTPKDVYDYVVANLTYDYSRINNASRRQTPDILANTTSALCTDFTDLYVTLARSIGIPAREIEGYAYSNNTKVKPINPQADVLHAWPQFYDKNTQSWHSIDPTWGKTTNGIDFFTDLDLNHFAFVIHGLSDNYPPPPGSFKNPSNQKSVNVTFAINEFQPATAPIQLENDTLINPNLFALTHVQLTTTENKWQYTSDLLPPLSYTKVGNFSPGTLQILLPKNAATHLTFQSDQSQDSQTLVITNRNHYLYLSLVIAGAILFLCVCGILISKSR